MNMTLFDSVQLLGSCAVHALVCFCMYPPAAPMLFWLLHQQAVPADWRCDDAAAVCVVCCPAGWHWSHGAGGDGVEGGRLLPVTLSQLGSEWPPLA
jgi:hypothetical protein